MRNFKPLVLFSFVLFAFQFSGCSQATKESRMREVTRRLISSLQNCDTAKILEMYDVSASHIDKENYRNFVKESILNDCALYNKVIGKEKLPKLEKLTFTKDPQNQANVAVLPLLAKEDSTLKLKSCTLYVMFSPDQFFNGKILRFTVAKESILKSNTDKIKPLPM